MDQWKGQHQKREKPGRRRPGEAATACPGMLSSHSGCRHKAFPVFSAVCRALSRCPSSLPARVRLREGQAPSLLSP